MRVAVVGHVEWVEFLRVPKVPAPGDIVHATEVFEQAAGGGGVASVQLRKLAGACSFFTALGDDEIGHRAFEDLRGRGVDLHVAWRADAQRRAVTFVDEAGERAVTGLGGRWGAGQGRGGARPWAGGGGRAGRPRGRGTRSATAGGCMGGGGRRAERARRVPRGGWRRRGGCRLCPRPPA